VAVSALFGFYLIFGVYPTFGIFRQNKKNFPAPYYPNSCLSLIFLHLPQYKLIRQMPANPSSTHKLGLKLRQFDIKTAFLIGWLGKTVFMEIPEGLIERLGVDKNYAKEYVCVLQRSLYGLKVSPKRWYVKFAE
jgi:hypothetical protein